MTYRNLIIYSTIAVALGASSCSKDFTVQDPYNQNIVESQYFQNEEECNAATKAAYRFVLYEDWWQRQNFRFLAGEAASDNAWVGNTYQGHPTWDAVAWYTLDAANDRVEAHWIMTYKAIGIFNHTIRGIEAAPISEQARSRFLGELKSMRAYLYLDLVRNWGDVPMVLNVEAPSARIPNTPKETIYDQLVTDLSAAAAVLPRKSAYSAGDNFRISRGAALAILSKVYLYREDWANAELTAKQVVDLGDYQLEQDFGNLWNYNNKNGIESIFEIQFSTLQTPGGIPSNLYIDPMNSTADAGWGYISVTSDLENAYLEEGDEIRRQWTINKHQEPVVGDPAKPSFDGRPSQSKSARFGRKRYVPVAQRPTNGRYGFNDLLIRLGDILLVHAEAAAMQNKSDVARGSLQLIRNRVGLDTDMSLTGWDLINAVRKERRLETAMEGERLYDIRRWKDESGQPVINSIFGPNGSFVVYNTQQSTDAFELGNTTEPQDKGTNFRPGVHNLWPIPAVEISAAQGTVTQNNGY